MANLASQPTTLGLIAGNGRFPLLFARAAKAKGIKIIAVAIKGDTSMSIKGLVDKLFWVSPGQLQRLFDIFQQEGVKKVIMAGQVNPKNLFDKRFSPDGELQKIFEKLRDKNADTIFSAVADKLQALGMDLIASTTLLDDFLCPAGVFTKRSPTQGEWEDIRFGKEIAKAVAYFDIGQTVVVKQKAVLAVEALEGTDVTIRRGGKIGRGNSVVVKVSKPKQDMRFDIPVIGLKTIHNLIRAKISCLAVEAGKTLFLDKEASIALADKKGICIIAA
ncbi:MAG: UDP-2,3-diacylglucosamine diphosphatase LpxI [Candidatus Omnitrophota bacterium]|nr:UDP-2,3-diacylglucosamine diphosphatase LpxI [Candidatus Omnitrophota bacterium]